MFSSYRAQTGLSIHPILDFFCIHTLVDFFCSSIASNFAMLRPPAFGLSGSLVARFEHPTSVSRIVARSPYYCTTGDAKPEIFFYCFCCGSCFNSSVKLFFFLSLSRPFSFFPPLRKSDPRASTKQALLPLCPHHATCLHVYREKTQPLSSLADSYRIALLTLLQVPTGALSR